MTQAQFDIQNLQNNELEQTSNTVLTNQPLFNDSPVLFLEVMVQDPSVLTSEQSSSEQHFSNIEQIEHQTPPEKQRTPPEANDFEQSLGTPHPPLKKDLK